MNDKFKLDGHEPVVVEDLLEWAKWMQTADRRVARDEPVPGVVVSTVFLGLDHSFGRGIRPMLFETIVFGGELDNEMDRYCTWEEAEKGHAAMVEKVKAVKV